MNDEIQRIERLERTVNALRNCLIDLYKDTELLADELTKLPHLQNFHPISELVERHKKVLETLREIHTA